MLPLRCGFNSEMYGPANVALFGVSEIYGLIPEKHSAVSFFTLSTGVDSQRMVLHMSLG